MGSSIYFPLSAIPFSILLIVLCFSKKTVNSVETKIYKYLVLVNFVGLILELLCTYASLISSSNVILSDFILKSYLLYNIVWTYILTAYVYYVSKMGNEKSKNKNIKTISMYLLPLAAIITFVLKCNLVVSSDFSVRYTNGPSVIFTYFLCGIFILLMILFILYNFRNLNNKKYIPIYSFIVTIIIGIAIQLNYPEILIMTYIETLTLSIMYFTIENPDIKMIEELSKNRKLLENTIQDKSNFLFRMSNEINQPIKNIETLTNVIKEENDISIIKKEINNIYYETKYINNVINDILDVSPVYNENIKKYQDKYSFKRIYDEIIIRMNSKANETFKFSSSINAELPKYLYGDFIKTKQIIFAILDDSIKNNTSFIDFNVDNIIKNDICRLIISISDSVKNLDVIKINKILSSTDTLSKEELKLFENGNSNLSLIYKVIKLLGGNLIIKASESGRQFIITFDSLIVKQEKSEFSKKIENYDNLIVSKYKILIIDNKTSFIKKITDILKEYDVELTSNISGVDAFEKIKNGANYDLILLDDEMKEISGYEVFKKLSSIKKFKIPVIITLEKDKDFIKDHYIEDGFADYLLKDDLENETIRIMKKYFD